MYIKNIKLKNFRNYRDLDLDFNRSRNVIIGENAQGKTNLIESVYLCAFSRSFRTRSAADMVMIGEKSASVSVDVFSDDLDKNISISLNDHGGKMIKKDGVVLRRTADLLNNLVVVVFSPEDLRIVKDGPEKRRDFINREMSQLRPSYYNLLKDYNSVLREKNALLKEGPESKNIDMLDIYDLQMAKYGIQIIRARRKFIGRLSEIAGGIHSRISGGTEEMRIQYRENTDDQVLQDTIFLQREKELRLGHAIAGPHRDDMEFYINGMNARNYGSQGQQRTIALSLKLAEIKIAKEMLGENPVLILDDVLSEFDLKRQSFLFNEIEDVQQFLTSAEVNRQLIENMDEGWVFQVKNGTARRVSGDLSEIFTGGRAGEVENDK